MRIIRLAAGMNENFDYGHVVSNIKEALDAGCDICHSDAVDMYEIKDSQLIGGHSIIYYIRKNTDKPIECHLYSQECDLLFIEKMAFVGCNLLILQADRFIGSQLVDIIKWCTEKNIKVGLSIGSYTPLSAIEEAIYEIDRLHIELTGAKGGLRNGAIDLIKRARAIIDAKNPDCELSVEGCIDYDNIEAILSSEPDIVVLSDSIFNDSKSIASNVKKFREAVDKYSK